MPRLCNVVEDIGDDQEKSSLFRADLVRRRCRSARGLDRSQKFDGEEDWQAWNRRHPTQRVVK